MLSDETPISIIYLFISHFTLKSAMGRCTKAEEDQLNHQIDEQIKKDKEHVKRRLKLLLLGSGESGKTTFLKQMKVRT